MPLHYGNFLHCYTNLSKHTKVQFNSTNYVSLHTFTLVDVLKIDLIKLLFTLE